MIKFEDFHKILASVVIVENLQGNILLLKRFLKSKQQGWCLPGGKRDEGENINTTAKRELFEETGLDFNESELTFVGNRFSVKGFGVAVYYIKLKKLTDVELSDEHYDYVWTTNYKNYDLAGNTMDFINCVNQNILESKSDDMEFLKEFCIRYETKEECIEIVRSLKKLGFDVYGYPDSCNDVDESVDFFMWVGFLWNDSSKFFVQVKSGHKNHKKALFFIDFMDIIGKRFIKKLNPEEDPFGEEDWGYVED